MFFLSLQIGRFVQTRVTRSHFSGREIGIFGYLPLPLSISFLQKYLFFPHPSSATIRSPGLDQVSWIDAAVVGASTPARLHLGQVRPWLIEATGRQSRQMVNMDKFGFPRGRAKGPSCVHGFKTGDLIKARVTKGKKVGVYLGRVAVKSDGYFKLTGRPFGMVEGIHARYCTPLQRKDGYQYAQGGTALSLHA